MNSLFSGPLSISDLLNFKALEPLDSTAKEIVERIQSLDVGDYSEADVREEVISHLLRVLGYDKQSNFSIDREKGLQLLGRKSFPDYSLTLWSENFWLIEAKRPKRIGTITSQLQMSDKLWGTRFILRSMRRWRSYATVDISPFSIERKAW